VDTVEKAPVPPVKQHRLRRLSPGRRRTLLLLAAVLSLAAPIILGAAVLVGRTVKRDSGTALWTVPTKLELSTDSTGVGGPPTRVRIAAIGVDSPLESLVIDGTGALQSPTNFGEAGWFSQGTEPGDAGPAVIAGHVDTKSGPAVFYRLRDLKPGDQAQVQRGPTWLTFRVTATDKYPKAAFPTAKVYGPTPDPELRLITCGGTFDPTKNSYRDNVVVYLVLA
jgi:hypothetical protein